MDLGIYLRTFLQGRLVGQDEFGNRYFEEKRPKAGQQAKRWVLYKGKAEASSVPASWHGWLHYTFAEPPKAYEKQSWEKPHLPNLTGTPFSHSPTCDNILHPKQNKEIKNHGPVYEPWKPNTK